MIDYLTQSVPLWQVPLFAAAGAFLVDLSKGIWRWAKVSRTEADT